MGKKQGKKGSKAKHKGSEHSESVKSNGSPLRRSKRNRKQVPNNDNDYQLRAKIEAGGVLTIVDMDPDGNCLFRSLSDQLYHDYGNTHDDVRADICDYLEAFEDEFRHFMVLDETEEDEDAADYESYVQNMREDGEWGGNIELVAAARLYCRNITLYQIGAAFVVGPGADTKVDGPPVLLSYHENEHYNSVRDSNVPTPLPPVKIFEKCISISIDNDTTDLEDTEDEEEDEEDEDEEPSQQRQDMQRKSSICEEQAPPKNKDPCPCGSGRRFKKCCLAKEKRAARVEKMRDDDAGSRDASESEEETEGAFRILTI